MDRGACITNRTRSAIRTIVLMLVVVSLGERAESQTIVNGSFETGNYIGWTLFEDVYDHDWGIEFDPTSGTWGLATNGSIMNSNDAAFDYSDGIEVVQSSKGLPITFQSTDGDVVAFHLQNFAGVQRMSQDIVLAPNAEVLMWEMQYANHSRGGFMPFENYLAVNFRDPTTNNLLKTLYETTEGVDDQSIPMTPFAVDVRDFAGRPVRLEVELKNIFWFDLMLDNFRISPPPINEVTMDVELNARKKINMRSNGVIAVAILGSQDFEVITEVDVETLAFGPGGATPVHSGHTGDVNGDGYWDAVVHVRVRDLGFEAPLVSAGVVESEPLSLCVAGTTLDGNRIEGCKDLDATPRGTPGKKK